MQVTENKKNIIVVSRYSELTPKIMIRILKSELNDFESGFCEQYLSKAAKEYYQNATALVYEYISKVEKKNYDVGELRTANRGLEALMWYRYDVSSKADIDDLPFEEFLMKDNLKDAISQMHDNVADLVKKANCEELWRQTDWYSKTELLKKWGYTLMTAPEDIHDENSTFPFHSKRELRMFEKTMGREFEEFDSLLR